MFIKPDCGGKKCVQKGLWKQRGSREINLNSLTRCTGTKSTTVQMFSCILNFTDATRSIANNAWRELWSRCQLKWDSIPTAWSYPDASQPCGKQLPFTCLAAWIPCAPGSNTDPSVWTTPLGTCFSSFSDHTFGLATQEFSIVWASIESAGPDDSFCISTN